MPRRPRLWRFDAIGVSGLPGTPGELGRRCRAHCWETSIPAYDGLDAHSLDGSHGLATAEAAMIGASRLPSLVFAHFLDGWISVQLAGGPIDCFGHSLDVLFLLGEREHD